MNDLLLITPPFTQLNTPYPATSYLKGFLNTKGISAFQMDLGIEVILQLFSKKGLHDLFEFAGPPTEAWSENAARIYTLRTDYESTISDTIAFLQGKNPVMGRLIFSENYLPQASRFSQLENLELAFGNMGIHDQAKHFATLYLEDISDFIIECVDDNFGFTRYAERLGMSANSFDGLHTRLQGETSYIDGFTLSILKFRMKEERPKLVCFSVPFPGNLYSAFRSAQWIKQHFPEVKIAMGGGFPNTELRSLTDPRVFDYFDFITLDDGELPIELLAAHVLVPSATPEFKRTFVRENGQVVYHDNSPRADYKQSAVGTPDYSNLPLNRYISAIEIANPMHSLWTDGRWNKLTMAHGCYWGKCTFCDISLDYIRLYEPIAANTLVDRMEEIIAQTGENGFHFVDEAAPPALMKAVALEIIRRRLTVVWWTNIRFEKSFTNDLCQLLKTSGCIAVSGGLEVASDRLLALIDKGVTVEQVAQVTENFTVADIMVHAYLMYGYPTQSVQETVDSLEMVRQMFAHEILKSGFWHQFALTAHSPVGLNPGAFGVHPKIEEITFANNDIQFEDETGIDHGQFSNGLAKSLLNYMYGIGLDLPLQEWFDFKLPPTKVKPHFIENALIGDEEDDLPAPSAKVVWVGNMPIVAIEEQPQGAVLQEVMLLTFHEKSGEAEIACDPDLGNWLLKMLQKSSVHTAGKLTFGQFVEDFETEFEDFEQLWDSEEMVALRSMGLLFL